MPRPAHDPVALVQLLLDFGRHAPDQEARIAALLAAFGSNADEAGPVARALLERLQCQQRGLRAAQVKLTELEAVLEKANSAPWYTAVFIRLVETGRGPLAVVRQGSIERLVGLNEGVDPTSLQVGDTVCLAGERNVIVERMAGEMIRSGETCTFDRRTSDGRFVVRFRDEEFVVHPTSALAAAEVRAGDLLLWDRESRLAREKLERSSGSRFFLEETPRETFDDVGGLGPLIERVRNLLLLHFRHAATARRYRVPPKGSLLLCGPAGTGKTMIAKALANWLAELTPGGRAFFMNIKPAALHSMWYSESERQYREVFRVARETAAAHPGSRVVIFFDEVDAIGGSRGTSLMRAHDNVLTAFLAELDGLARRGDVLVVGATNRRESLDPALLRPGRLGDLVLEVPRPDRRAAQDIFGKHLACDIPYARNGHGDDAVATRAEIIAAAVSRIYAPNAGNELATMTFRDGRRQSIRAADLVSGAVIASIVHGALEQACLREVVGGEGGLRWNDVAVAIERHFETAARVLTPANCRNHLSGLPHDLDVVNVEFAARRVVHPQRFLNAS